MAFKASEKSPKTIRSEEGLVAPRTPVRSKELQDKSPKVNRKGERGISSVRSMEVDEKDRTTLVI